MEGENQTRVSEFVLLGLWDSPEQQQQRLFFWLFLWMYLLGGAGNLLMILATGSDPLLHTPMYFFLSNLSFVDLCLTTTTVPKMLLNIQTQKKTISYAGCLTQMYFFLLLLDLDNMILAVMAFDRYMAICHPLHYTSVMLPSLCGLLMAVLWVVANLFSLLFTLLMAQLSFCGNNTIPHFFCDLSVLLKLSCSDTHIVENLLLIVSGLLGVTPLMCILVSYSRIVATVMRIPSAKGKRKTFSTCGSHLTVVALFYCAGFGVFFTPPSSHSGGKDTAASVMYTVVTPMFNPFIYSLRNKDMKGALQKLVCKNTALPHKP
ncbi:olfactory receptor 1F1 [Ornithorhynchus anatinus]|uniref:Olfactory receptor n=1 Tax=Ornithorhynchus anatinus TaxID=9258 RepID=F6ST51_ORNAN|nr:olfactory receptor 1F1 [Ornithorhynchus anatinus]